MKTIEKCKICGEPYWDDPSFEKREGSGGVCPDCVEKANRKSEREMNKPPQY